MRLSIFVVLALLFHQGCRPVRKVTAVAIQTDTIVRTAVVDVPAVDSAKIVAETVARIAGKRIVYRTFAAKIKVAYKDSKDKNLDFNAFIRMQKDTVIWASIIAALGVEAFRVMVTPDSVMIMDKLEKTIRYTTISELQAITKLPFDFGTLQELLIGNPIYMDGEMKSYRDDGSLLSMSMTGSFFKHLLTFSKPRMELVQSDLDDIDSLRKRRATLSYEDYQPAGKWTFANTRRLALSEKERVDLLLEFRQVEFDQPQNYPFSIPKNYKLK
jgi:hypothetical protein